MVLAGNGEEDPVPLHCVGALVLDENPYKKSITVTYVYRNNGTLTSSKPGDRLGSNLTQNSTVLQENG